MVKKSLKITGIVLLVIALIGGAGVLTLKYIQKSMSPRQVLKGDDGSKIFCEELSFYGGDGKIYGKVYKPQDTLGRKKVVIYCHDIGGDSNEGKAFCEMAAKKGYVAYSFDFMGGSANSRSDGRLNEMSVLTEVANLVEVIKRIRKEEFAKKNSSYIAGYGLGGAVAALAASEMKKEVAGLILISADFNIKEFSEGLYSKVKDIPDTALVKGTPVGKKFFVDARNINVFRKLRKFDGPALIIHGTADAHVPIHFAEKANKELSGARLERIDGAGNELKGSYLSKVMRLSGSFLDEKLKD